MKNLFDWHEILIKQDVLMICFENRFYDAPLKALYYRVLVKY